MPFAFTFALAVAASLVEARFGYPAPLYRAIGHPVTWIGRAIDALERRFNDSATPEADRRRAGIATIAALVMATGAAAWLAQAAALRLNWVGFALLALAASSLLARRSLEEHVEAVAKALESEGIEAGRAAVARIVGRDVAALDGSGVARAAIESLAENFSDGWVAPLFWMSLAGLPGAAIYKAINTADSMIGHLLPRFAAFGMASARLDDLVNWPAARLAGLALALAAWTSGRDSGAAFRAMARDAKGHRSPNAGWPEAAMAGALGLKLAGPRAYGGVQTSDAFMGEGRRDAGPDDIRRALALFAAACRLSTAALAILAIAAVLVG